jgi:hypothetical protein
MDAHDEKTNQDKAFPLGPRIRSGDELRRKWQDVRWRTGVDVDPVYIRPWGDHSHDRHFWDGPNSGSGAVDGGVDWSDSEGRAAAALIDGIKLGASFGAFATGLVGLVVWRCLRRWLR